MDTIGDLIARDLSREIEEVIKLDQQDEKTVHDEITEYVATESIRKHYAMVLQAIADSQGEPTEAVGVWVSGFFGSGKSSFAKNLGYVLANPTLLGTPAAKLFVKQLRQQSPNDPIVDDIENRLDYINKRIPAHVVMFDVRVDAAVRRTTEPLAEIMYTVLLRELDYAQDFDVAALEMELEGEGRLAGFIQACAKHFAGQVAGDGEAATSVPVTLKGIAPEDYRVWQLVRKGAQKIQRTSAALHYLDPRTYPNKETWAQSIKGTPDITVRDLVERTFELTARRRPNQTIIFVIDEVGGYVASSSEKLENLRAVVEQFGKEGKNRVEARKAIAPAWIVVTSQEKLDEVVAAIGDKRIELPKVKDRFRYSVDMAPADIREVATKRVLSKKPAAIPVLRELYSKTKGQLQTHTQPDRSTKISFQFDEEDFVQFYPYLPHFIELSIDIVSGLRLQPGAPRHYGGSNRTIIKQAYEMLAGKQTNLANAKVGTLVTIDRIYDLLSSSLPSERQKDMYDIEQRWKDDLWVVRVAKAICLLEYTRGLLRSEKTISALLYDTVDSPSPLPEVKRGIEALARDQFIRETEDGWKLLTAQEKNWSAERNSLTPSAKERNDIWEEALTAAFQEPALSRFTYKKRTFALSVTWLGRAITSSKGQIPLELKVSDRPDRFEADCEAVRVQSREKKSLLFWVFAATDEIDDLVVEVYRSKQMVAKYDQLRAQNKLHPEESASLATEKQDVLKLQERLKNLLLAEIERGKGFQEGVEYGGPGLGRTAADIVHGLLDQVMTKLYPRLEEGSRPIKGDEAEEILKAANLNGLPKVYYGGNEGLELVLQDHGKFIINDNAPVAKAILSHIQSEHSYGNKVTGRMLEDYFGDMPFGWEREILWIVLATLLRKGTVEVTYQGRRFRNHLDPQVRAVFAGGNAFRAASFAPRKAPDLQALVTAAKRYEELTGDEVDVDENAIAQAFRKLATAERENLLSVEAVVRANNIPVADILSEYRGQLNSIISSPSDDVVNILVGEGETFKRLRQRVQEIRKATDDAGLKRLRRARNTLERLWPPLAQHAADGDLQAGVGKLGELLKSDNYFQQTAQVDEIAGMIEKAYSALYHVRHGERAQAFRAAIDLIKGLPDWTALTSETQQTLLTALTSRACGLPELGEGAVVCAKCGSSLSEMESDLLAVNSLRDQVIRRLQEFARPEDKVQRVRVTDVVNTYQALSTPDEVNKWIEQLREQLLKLVESGTKVMLE